MERNGNKKIAKEIKFTPRMKAVNQDIKKEIEELKICLCKQNIYPPKNIKYWTIFNIKYKGVELIDINKNIEIYQKRIEKTAVILRRFYTELVISWFVLSCENSKFKIYLYNLDLQGINFAQQYPLSRKKVATITDHALEQIINRKYRQDYIKALFVCCDSVLDEHFMLFEMLMEKLEYISAYEEKMIESKDSGVFMTSYEPPQAKSLFGHITLITYISEEMRKPFNDEEINSPYYYQDKFYVCKDAKALVEKIFTQMQSEETKTPKSTKKYNRYIEFPFDEFASSLKRFM